MFYNFKAKTLNGEELKFDRYKDKLVLVVNTASECGLTPQFEGLQKLHEKYHHKGLNILGFPCNQFGHQEPGSEKDIAEGCVINYGVEFQMFSKIKVNGKDAHPLFKYLKSKKGTFLFRKIKWNFTKFLVDQNGKVVERFGPTTTPNKIETSIKKYIAD